MANRATQRLTDTPADIVQAAEILRAGGLVAFPTETVYGLGANARDTDAVRAIYAAKGRPAKNPLIVHVADLDGARRVAVFDDCAEALAQAFWPGPLTLVLPLRPEAGIAAEVTAGQASVALRMPAHPVAQAILRASGLALAAPSANPSGAVSPTTAAHVLEGLSGRIDAVVDGGACPVGVESTIVGLLDAPVLLRPGGLPSEAVEACLGVPLARPGADPALPLAPGQLASHYAPRAALRLNAGRARAGEVLLGFGPVTGAAANLSPAGDLAEAAANLFACLRALDATGAAAIAVSPIPETGLGLAINDRLRRAAAPRG
ncbi:L-threonylcarbamoyladenylate synthase [Palleronia sp. KMU-117]|uniref:L-threonylcarbamoyladenylate synthase n=1 Tax=Palleronia sp. KMU-117 TaxID=3434108 RepID=UPI003D73E75B